MWQDCIANNCTAKQIILKINIWLKTSTFYQYFIYNSKHNDRCQNEDIYIMSNVCWVRRASIENSEIEIWFKKRCVSLFVYQNNTRLDTINNRFFLNLTKTNLFFDNLLQRRNNVVFLQYINVGTKICSGLNNQNNIGWVSFLFCPYNHFCWGNTKKVSYFPYDEDLFWSRLINEKWCFIIFILFCRYIYFFYHEKLQITIFLYVSF